MIGQTISHYKILAKLGEACPAKGSRQARGGMSSLIRDHKKLTPSPGPSFSEKYNKLVPQGARRHL
jgi:hypothetical protein